MKSNNFIDITMDNYYLNPYKFMQKNLNIFNKKTLSKNNITNTNKFDKLIIFKLIANNNIDKLNDLIDNNTLLDINIQDKDGDTALHIAIFLSNYNACSILIKHNANIFIRDKWGQTPLHRLCFALENKSTIKIIDLINENQLNNKDNIFNSFDKFNNTPLHLVIKYLIKNKIKLNKNILFILHKLISLTNIKLVNNDGLSCKNLLTKLNIT